MNTHPLERLYKTYLKSAAETPAIDITDSIRNASSIDEKRILYHIKVKTHIASGETEKALSCIDEIWQNYGEHISILCEEATVYYLMNNFWKWEQINIFIEKKFLLISDKLSLLSYLRTCLVLSKNYEELGRIEKSKKFLHLGLNKLKKSPLTIENIEFNSRINANLARIASIYGTQQECKTYYVELQQYLRNNHSFGVQLEIAHALILVEAALYGNVAWETNYKTFFENKAREDEQALVLIDLLYIMEKNKLNSERVLKKLSFINSLNPFEKKLFDLVNNNIAATDGWVIWPSAMPIGNFLLLYPFLISKLQQNEIDSYYKQVQIILETLPEDEKLFWQKYLSIKEPKQKKIVADIEKLQINHESFQVKYDNRPLLFGLLKEFAVGRKFEISHFTKILYQSDHNQYSEDRIRQLVKRINVDFYKQFKVKLLLIRAKKVILADEFEILKI